MKLKLTFLLFVLILIASCNNNLQKEKELNSEEKELDLKTTETKSDVKTTMDPTKIADQKFNDYAPKIQKSKGGIIANQEIFVGDLNNDDLNDAVIWFSVSPEGGNATLCQGLSVYINTGNDMKVIAGYEPEYLFNVIKISNNKIKITKLEYADDDAPGWPSIENVKYLMLNGNHLIEANN
ncbi:MAG: hypothetical protein ABI426_08130 [Flavobacterium sp.]